MGIISPQRLSLRQQEQFEEVKQRYGIGVGGNYGYPPNNGWNQGYAYNGGMNNGYNNGSYGNSGYGNNGYNNGYSNDGYGGNNYGSNDGYGMNNGVKKVDDNTVIINGVEYKKNN